MSNVVRFSTRLKAPIPLEIDVAPVVKEHANDDDEITHREYGPEVIKEFMVPRFRRGDWKAWGARIDADRRREVVGDLTPEQGARLLLMYPLQPLTHNDMIARIATVEGTGRIVETCWRRAGVPEHAIVRAVEEGDADEQAMETLAMMLAGVVDPEEVAKRIMESERARTGKTTGEGGDDAQGDGGGREPSLNDMGGDAGEGGGGSDSPPRAEGDPADPFTRNTGGSKT